MLGNLLRELLGLDNGAVGQAKKGAAGAAIGGGVGSARKMKPKIPPKRQKLPMEKMLPMKPYANPAQPQFPGRTNYGVPQDNMIDTSMGYLTNDQFNQGATGRLQRQSNPMDFDTIPNNFTAGRTGYYQGSNPYLQGGGANQYEELKNRLRVR